MMLHYDTCIVDTPNTVYIYACIFMSIYTCIVYDTQLMCICLATGEFVID